MGEFIAYRDDGHSDQLRQAHAQPVGSRVLQAIDDQHSHHRGRQHLSQLHERPRHMPVFAEHRERERAQREYNHSRNRNRGQRHSNAHASPSFVRTQSRIPDVINSAGSMKLL